MGRSAKRPRPVVSTYVRECSARSYLSWLVWDGGSTGREPDEAGEELGSTFRDGWRPGPIVCGCASWVGSGCGEFRWREQEEARRYAAPHHTTNLT